MLFNSVQFLIFFVIVASVYFAIPHKLRTPYLLAASCYFYMAFVPQYILILFFLIIIDYFAGIWIEVAKDQRQKKIYLTLSILSTCAVLFFFKYFNFFNSIFADIAQFFNLNYPVAQWDILLPIGLSFHTFQSLSYVIEVYRGNQKAERHFGTYSLFVMFFPQLVAGPIERAGNLLHQFYERHTFDYARVTGGLKLVLWGLFKKVVIADRLAVYANAVYNNPYDYSGWPLIVATVFFAFQIYCDFSGYSDIAIGVAQVLGFRLMDNFNRPYFSKSVPEFWKRWHISLTSWFKDYLYIPLGGNRVGKPRWYLNLFIVFLLSGFWHGANWTFIVWGALNGFYLLCSIWTSPWRARLVRRTGIDRFPKLHKLVKVTIPFSLICFSWIFFRANNLSEAAYISGHLFSGLSDAKTQQVIFSGFGYGYKGLLLAVAAVLFMEYIHSIQRHKNIRNMLLHKPAPVRVLTYASLVVGILLFGKFNNQQFIYEKIIFYLLGYHADPKRLSATGGQC